MSHFKCKNCENVFYIIMAGNCFHSIVGRVAKLVLFYDLICTVGNFSYTKKNVIDIDEFRITDPEIPIQIFFCLTFSRLFAKKRLDGN